MGVINLYRTASAMTAVNVVELGDISGWDLSQMGVNDNVIASRTNMTVAKFTRAFGSIPDATVINKIDFGGTATINLYANNSLHYGVTVYSYDTTRQTYSNAGYQTSGTNTANLSVRRSETNWNKIFLARATVDGVKYVGFFVYNERPNQVGQGGFYANRTASDNFLSEAKFVGEIDADINGLDGEGDYTFTGDNIDMPTAPDETISGALASGFLNIYKPSAAQLQAFGAALWTNAFNVKWFNIDSVANLVLNAVSNPIDFIIGLFMIPVTPNTTGSNGVYLGGINVNTITPPKVTKQYVTLDFGTINISELYGNYLDYSNSRVSIYLPYIGTADIDVQEINGGSVELQYIVDCFTGACVANVRCVKTTKSPWGTAYENSTVHSYSGNMAIQLPISAGSFDTLTQGLINVGLGLGTNTPAIAMTGAKDVIQGFAGDVTTRGSLSSNTGKLGYQTPYLMFTRPIESRPANLGALHGYSAGVGGVLSAFSGYVVCSDVKLDGVTATDSELNEIDSILKSGVYV